ncbi:MAG: deoxyribonuclease V [Candidatus Latescibacterota bacterium]
MQVRALHDWELDCAEAVALQRTLSARVRVEPLPREPRWIAGADVHVRGAQATAAVVVLALPELRPEEVRTAARALRFPYVPGLLSFREAPVIAAACAELERAPDLLLVDGQGIAHPRRLGLASHLGLLLERPTIGCAKSCLCGQGPGPGQERGSWSALRAGDEVVGAALRTRARVRPVFVSVGHRITLQEAIGWVLATTGRYRLPEPLRLAHQAAGGGPMPSR